MMFSIREILSDSSSFTLDHNVAHTLLLFRRNEEVEIVPHGEGGVHRRRLELSADAQLGDLMFLKADQIRGLSEHDATGHWPHFSGDHVQQRAFAGSVGADHDSKLVIIHHQVEHVQGFKPVKFHRDAFKVHDRMLMAGSQ